MSLIIPLGTNLSSGVTSRSAFSDSFLGNDCRYVTQSGHGFNPLDAIRYNGTTWVKAISTSEGTLADGLVIYVIGDSFLWASSGVYTLTGHGLTLNSKYYLTDTSGISATTPGTYSQYLFTPLTANEIVVGISANPAISTPLSAGQIGYASGVTSLTGSNNLFYDSANTRLSVGIGTSPSESIHTNGNILIDAASERGLMVKYSGDLNGNANISNPIWTLGRLVEGGVANHSVFRYIFYSDDQGVERSVFEVEDTGTIASVSDGTRRSHVEGFLNNGDTQPIFRLSSSVGSGDMGLQMGVGGTTAPDVEFARNGSNSAYLALGGSAKTIWYADAFVYQPGINAVLANTSGLNPELRFMEEDGNGSNYVGFKAPASVATNKIWTLPNADSTGTQSLVSNGSGVLSFASYLPISGGTLTGALTLSGDPVNPLEPVTKQYLEAVMQSWKWKNPNAVVTDVDANVDISTALEDGDTLNGVVLATGDLVLLRTQTAPAENGLWEVQATGAAVRPSIFNTWSEVVGAAVIVTQGTSYADSLWLCTNDPGGTLGTTAITFTRIPTGSGITGTFSSGQVAYANGTTSLTGNGNFTYDNTAVNLHVRNSSGTGSSFQCTDSLTGATSGDGFAFGIDGSQHGYIYQAENKNIRIVTNSIDRGVFQNDGYFGWGTTTAITPHHIHSAAADGFTHYTTGANTAANRGFDSGISTNGSAYAWLYENSYYQIATNNTSRFYVGSDGIVNIGQSSTQTVAQFFVKNTLASYEVARLKGHASQTGGYFNIVTSADVSLFRVDVSGNVFVSGASADFYIENQRRLILRDSDNSNHVSLKSPATVASNVDLILPNALPTSNGQALVCDTSGNLSFSDVGSAAPISDLLTNTIIFDDFLQGKAVTNVSGYPYQLTSAHGWAISQAASSGSQVYFYSAAQSSTLKTVGVLRLRVDSGTTPDYVEVNSGYDTVLLGQFAMVFESKIMPSHDGSDVQRYYLQTGIADSVSVNYAVCFVSDYQTYSDTNWRAITKNSGANITTTDTGVAGSASAYKKFRIEINSAGTEAKFYIDGSLVATHTTNLPSGAAISYGTYFIKKANANPVYCDIDYMYYKATLSGR